MESVPLQRRFTQGDTEGEDFTPSRPTEIYTADGRQLDEDEEGAAQEDPCMTTAFDATIWSLIEDKKQATTEELRVTLGQARDVPGPVSAAHVPVPDSDPDEDL